MTRALRLLACAALVALPLQVAGALGAHAVWVPDMDSANCTASGSISTSEGPVPQTVSFSGSMTLRCTGLGDEAGTWSLSMSGQMSPGFCAGGQGLADVAGNGPDGSVSAGASLTQSATTLHVTATMFSNDQSVSNDELSADLVITWSSGVPCASTDTTGTITGTATITDTPAPDEVDCVAQGSEAYAPALSTTLAGIAVNGSASLTCTQPKSDDQGLWSVTWTGGADADCGVANGTLSMGGTAHNNDGTITSGSANYERVGTMIEIYGDLYATHDHGFDIWGAVTPNGNCATTAWSGSNITGDAVIAE